MRIDEQVVVADADILVGVPCYKDGPMVERCLRSLVAPKVQILIVDNGSPPDVRRAIDGRGIVIRNRTNRYVNPAWNQLMAYFRARPSQYDLLVIANSDLVLDPGWAAELRAHRQRHPQEQVAFGVDIQRKHPTFGAFFAMTHRAVDASYPIPSDLLIMGGDDFIFQISRWVGNDQLVIESLTMTHVGRGTLNQCPELDAIAKRDTERWFEYVRDKIVPRRAHEILNKLPRTV
jgi:glycosyltransferase involved in cell wall biosynthesis